MRVRRWVVVVLGLEVCVGVGEGEEERGLVEEALALERRGAVEEAIGRLGGVESWEGKFHRGRMLAGVGRYEEAEVELRGAVERRPGQGVVSAMLGGVLLREGKIEEAVAHLERALEATGGADEVRLELARALHAGGRSEAALAHAEALALKHPEAPEIQQTLGEAYFKLGRSDRAMQAAQSWKRLRPAAADPELLSARIALRLDLPEIALRHARTAQELEPASGPAAFVAGLAQERLGQRAGAADRYRQARALGFDAPELRVRLAAMLSHDYRMEEARRELEQAVERFPESADLHFELGRLLRSLGERERAARELERALALAPELAEAHLELAIQAETDQDLERAERGYRRALELAPSLQPARYRLGSLLRRRGQLDQAERLLQEHDRWVRGQEQHEDQRVRVQMLIHTASDHLQQGRIQEALSYAQRAAAEDPASVAARLIEAGAHLAAHQPQAALRSLQTLGPASLELPEVRRLAAAARAAAGEPEPTAEDR